MYILHVMLGLNLKAILKLESRIFKVCACAEVLC